MIKPLYTALCSFGMSGIVFHAPLLNVHHGFTLKKILERTKNLSREKYDVEIVRDYKDILKDKNIDLVIVNTPDDLHFDMTLQALHGGKHVVVEKPFTLLSAQGEELIALARKKGLILTVFQNRRWDGDFLTVKKIIDEGKLGRLVSYEAHFDRHRKSIQDSWKEDDKTGTGTIYNLGTHLIDQALVLFGMPVSVYANIEIRRTGGRVDDYFDISLEYAEKYASLKGSYLVREPGPKYMVHGTEGSFLKYGFDPQEEALKNGILPGSEGWGEEPEKDWGILNTEINGIHVRRRIETIPGNYNLFYDNLYHVLKGDADLLVKPDEALNAIKIIELAKISSKEGRKIRLKA